MAGPVSSADAGGVALQRDGNLVMAGAQETTDEGQPDDFGVARLLAYPDAAASISGRVFKDHNANGKVVKSQLASTIKNPKVSGCILKSVQSWKFPRPMAGAAKGVYSISYQ